MPEHPLHDHIRAVAERPPAEMQRLALGLLRACWPGGGADRVEPGALTWVRRWRPVASAAGFPPCECAAGRCRVCN